MSEQNDENISLPPPPQALPVPVPPLPEADVTVAQRACEPPSVPARQPGEGIDVEAKWGDPKSTKAYGHSRSEHGSARNEQELKDRARSTGDDQGQWDNDAFIVEAEQRAPMAPGSQIVDMGKPVGRVHRPDGSTIENVTTVLVVRKREGTVRTSFPVIRRET
jgi:hypothetical protein